jgi:hypothetical protein
MELETTGLGQGVVYMPEQGRVETDAQGSPTLLYGVSGKTYVNIGQSTIPSWSQCPPIPAVPTFPANNPGQAVHLARWWADAILKTQAAYGREFALCPDSNKVRFQYTDEFNRQWRRVFEPIIRDSQGHYFDILWQLTLPGQAYARKAGEKMIFPSGAWPFRHQYAPPPRPSAQRVGERIVSVQWFFRELGWPLNAGTVIKHYAPALPPATPIVAAPHLHVPRQNMFDPIVHAWARKLNAARVDAVRNMARWVGNLDISEAEFQAKARPIVLTFRALNDEFRFVLDRINQWNAGFSRIPWPHYFFKTFWFKPETTPFYKHWKTSAIPTEAFLRSDYFPRSPQKIETDCATFISNNVKLVESSFVGTFRGYIQHVQELVKKREESAKRMGIVYTVAGALMSVITLGAASVLSITMSAALSVAQVASGIQTMKSMAAIQKEAIKGIYGVLHITESRVNSFKDWLAVKAVRPPIQKAPPTPSTVVPKMYSSFIEQKFIATGDDADAVAVRAYGLSRINDRVIVKNEATGEIVMLIVHGKDGEPIFVKREDAPAVLALETGELQEVVEGKSILPYAILAAGGAVMLAVS